jgi:hypothetical protein
MYVVYVQYTVQGPLILAYFIRTFLCKQEHINKIFPTFTVYNVKNVLVVAGTDENDGENLLFCYWYISCILDTWGVFGTVDVNTVVEKKGIHLLEDAQAFCGIVLTGSNSPPPSYQTLS